MSLRNLTSLLGSRLRFSSRCNVLHVICEHYAIGAVLLSCMRLVRSAMGEYLVLALGTAGYRWGPLLRKGTYGTFLIGQSAPFLIHRAQIDAVYLVQIRSSLNARNNTYSSSNCPLLYDTRMIPSYHMISYCERACVLSIDSTLLGRRRTGPL